QLQLKENSQKGKFITPLTISNDDSSENFGKMSVVKRLRCGVISSPLFENFLSAGVDVAGTHNTLNAA
ncbi:unnamed protein product, partial [Rotaria socialis]